MLRFNGKSDFWYSFASWISIHPMLRFNAGNAAAPAPWIKISIHPMLRFNSFLLFQATWNNCISIHPMLRFNIRIFSCFFPCTKISIHPMLRFNLFKEYYSPKCKIFQYILCYGSTEKCSKDIASKLIFQYILCYGSTANNLDGYQTFYNFNTSYVTVQLKWFEWLVW